MEVPDLVRHAATRFGGRDAYRLGMRSLTFADIDDRAGRVAGAIRAAGLVTGDRVVLLCQNEIEYTELRVGAQRAGAIFVPVNYRLAEAEIADIIADCSPRLLVHGPGYGDIAERLGIDLVWHFGSEGAGRAYDDVLAAHDANSRVALIPAEAPGMICYTSGTTGKAKGVVLSNFALHEGMVVQGHEMDAQPHHTFLQIAPMFHISLQVCNAFTYRGATAVIHQNFDVEETLAAIARDRITHALMVPIMITSLLESPQLASTDVASLVRILYGAAPMPPEVARRAIEMLGCGFVNGYGLTEATGLSMLRPEDHDVEGRPHLLETVGRDAIAAEVRICSDDWEKLPTGCVGHITARAPSLMDGYWNNPEATERSLYNGWLRTGDVGYRTDEGYLHLTDRADDMIITGGENVYPREVENALCGHPDVVEAAVIGLPSHEWGQAVHAVVVLRDAAPRDVTALRNHCRTFVAGYKVPKSIEFVNELPRNASGKVLKRQLREGAALAEHSPDVNLPSPSA
jgi:acyl-CoA synthetase (AMP-forming)/AMP-acid ligase II